MEQKLKEYIDLNKLVTIGEESYIITDDFLTWAKLGISMHGFKSEMNRLGYRHKLIQLGPRVHVAWRKKQ